MLPPQTLLDPTRLTEPRIDQSDHRPPVIGGRAVPQVEPVVAPGQLDDPGVVVGLSEMNVAPVEQYLAESLSALAEARSGSERTVLPLYSSGMSPDNAADWPSSLAFPLNLLVIGTVNVDETTRVLSDRVLDRANVLQLSVAVSDAHHRPMTRAVQS